MKEKALSAYRVYTNLVTGMSDGLVIPLALAAGLTAAGSSPAVVMIGGLAEVVAGSIAMGWGGYSAARETSDHHDHSGEHAHGGKGGELQKANAFFESLGLSSEAREQAMAEVAKVKSQWKEFMRTYEKAELRFAKQSALQIAGFFALGGIVPLLPYFFMNSSREAFLYAAALTFLVLIVLGWFRGKLTGQQAWKSILRTLIIASLASLGAYMVARIFVGAV